MARHQALLDPLALPILTPQHTRCLFHGRPAMRTLQKLTQRFCLGALAALTFGSALAADPGVTNEKLVLGAVIPLSGPPSIIGKAIATTLKVWEQDVNSRGGIGGRKVDIRIEDDGYVPQRTVQGLKKLIDVEQIFALIGTSGSSQLLAMLPIIDEPEVPINAKICSTSISFLR